MPTGNVINYLRCTIVIANIHIKQQGQQSHFPCIALTLLLFSLTTKHTEAQVNKTIVSALNTHKTTQNYLSPKKLLKGHQIKHTQQVQQEQTSSITAFCNYLSGFQERIIKTTVDREQHHGERAQLPENKNPNNKSMMAKLKRELYLMTFKVTPFHGCFGSKEITKKCLFIQIFVHRVVCLLRRRCCSSMGKPEMNCLSLMHVCPLLKDFGCNKF